MNRCFRDFAFLQLAECLLEEGLGHIQARLLYRGRRYIDRPPGPLDRRSREVVVVRSSGTFVRTARGGVLVLLRLGSTGAGLADSLRSLSSCSDERSVGASPRNPFVPGALSSGMRYPHGASGSVLLRLEDWMFSEGGRHGGGDGVECRALVAQR